VPLLYSAITSTSSSFRYHNSTTAPTNATTAHYTAITPALSTANSVDVAVTSTKPAIPLSTSNAVALRKVTGTGLALIVAGSLFVVL
jgi:hypothetical protein